MTSTKPKVKNTALFIICTIIGILLFLTPVKIGGSSTLLIAVIADGITSVIKPILPWFLSILFSVSTILAVIHYFKPLKFLEKTPILQSTFEGLTPLKLIIRVIGTICFIFCSFGGPEFITSPATGGTMYDLIISLFAWHVISFYLFCFLMDFGAMDFIGILIQKIMRPIFTLPGNSAIDCMASWVGNGPFGVIITKMQYTEGYYTKREAAVVASCFSIVSISFCTVVAKTLNVLDHFGSYYLSLTISTLICAILLPRIWPLKRIENTYKPDAPKRPEIEGEGHLFKTAVQRASDKAGEAKLSHLIRRSNETAVDFVLTVFPTMMAYGTILLIVSEYTPVISWLSFPFKWILSACAIPEAASAAPAMIVGFVDMFLPAVAGAGITSAMTRFVIASVSISQLIYMTETGAVILKNRDVFDLSIGRLILIFLMRTAVSIPVAVIVAHIVF